MKNLMQILHHVGTRLNDRQIDGQIDYPNTPDISDNLEHKIKHSFYGTLKLIFLTSLDFDGQRNSQV